MFVCALAIADTLHEYFSTLYSCHTIYLNLVKLCRVFPKDLVAIILRNPGKAFVDILSAVRPRGCCQRKPGRPEDIFRADVAPHLKSGLIVPSHEEALPSEHFRWL